MLMFNNTLGDDPAFLQHSLYTYWITSKYMLRFLLSLNNISVQLTISTIVKSSSGAV